MLNKMNSAYMRRAVFRQFKKNKWIFYWFEWFKWHKEIEYQKHVNDSSLLKSLDKIKQEEKLVKDYWRLGTFHYYRYGLQYKHLTDEEILDYVPTYYFHKNIEKHHEGIDTIKFGDKWTQAILFEERNIPTAKVVCVVKNNICTNLMQDKVLDLKSVITEYLAKKGNKLFFKPTGNCGGAGILVLKRNKEFYVLNGQPISSLDCLNSALLANELYIVEENIIQSDQFMSINSSSVNTIRTIVQQEGNKMVIKTCILRMGRNGKEVDNSAQGGISINIDVNTGAFAERATAEHGGENITLHPDSGFKFLGTKVDNWGTIKKQIEEIANKLIDFHDVALDIALTPNGAILVEFNFRYGVEHQQCVVGGVRRIFSINNH